MLLTGRKRAVWELASSSGDEDVEPACKVPGDSDPTSSDLPSSSSQANTSAERTSLCGVTAWIEMTRSGLCSVKQLHRAQKRAVTLWTACSGTGAPKLALEASHQATCCFNVWRE